MLSILEFDFMILLNRKVTQSYAKLYKVSLFSSANPCDLCGSKYGQIDAA